jgi:hypothetical protein
MKICEAKSVCKDSKQVEERDLHLPLWGMDVMVCILDILGFWFYVGNYDTPDAAHVCNYIHKFMGTSQETSEEILRKNRLYIINVSNQYHITNITHILSYINERLYYNCYFYV